MNVSLHLTALEVSKSTCLVKKVHSFLSIAVVDWIAYFLLQVNDSTHFSAPEASEPNCLIRQD